MKKMLKKISLLLIVAMIVGIFQAGEVFAEAKYDEVESFHEGLAWVLKDGEYGCINKKGEEVVKVNLKYDEVGYFSEGLSWVRIVDRESRKYGYINKKGKEVVKPKYDDAWNFSEGIAPVREGDNWYIINKKGEVLIEI